MLRASGIPAAQSEQGTRAIGKGTTSDALRLWGLEVSPPLGDAWQR
jgi:hypothetical protein